MKKLRFTLAVTVLLVSAPAAYAFEQTQAGSSESAPAAAMAAPEIKTAPSGLPGVALTIPSDKQDEGGTVVRLPMIGVIGRLPKLDFGLELLYGADKEKNPEEDRILPDSSDNDLTIRGSVKHRF